MHLLSPLNKTTRLPPRPISQEFRVLFQWFLFVRSLTQMRFFSSAIPKNKLAALTLLLMMAAWRPSATRQVKSMIAATFIVSAPRLRHSENHHHVFEEDMNGKPASTVALYGYTTCARTLRGLEPAFVQNF